VTEDKKTPEEQAKAKFNELKEKIYGVDGFFNKQVYQRTELQVFASYEA